MRGSTRFSVGARWSDGGRSAQALSTSVRSAAAPFLSDMHMAVEIIPFDFFKSSEPFFIIPAGKGLFLVTLDVVQVPLIAYIRKEIARGRGERGVSASPVIASRVGVEFENRNRVLGRGAAVFISFGVSPFDEPPSEERLSFGQCGSRAKTFLGLVLGSYNLLKGRGFAQYSLGKRRALRFQPESAHRPSLG